ncbi:MULTISPECIES: MBL fold metallo-hydrolase [Petrotoga]|uniref:RNAse Z n=2 Tax=Petrotoga sibirica TaxID=156202 RepID=A0A4R8EGN5_9BACT|nr:MULTISPECIES: MBL fold metallo-hydrolase [Petrotoga]KUK81970.1 MAG: Beta-lactamase domain protein [Petrotoga mobilis]POZ88491.1 beta-lactamase [Petrotoga sibirica DSM 13575]POZ91365.1 beta-lactamase [Petrotoga sp. SL27]TDX11080.1 RNAse Z [Petrotoga sibirica]
MEFLIRSKALYTTWVFYKPDRILFDAGEGVSAELGNKIYGIEKILLTHSHVDHIAGLWGIVNTRNNAMGNRNKKLEIYYPKGSENIDEYLKFIGKMNKRLRYKIDFREITLSDMIPLNNKRFIKPFKTRHTPGEVSFGYQILEQRKRLKEEYRELKESEIKDLIINKKEDILENYIANILTISGDSLPIPPNFAKDCATLVHECTFFDEKDRKIRNHTSLSELKNLINISKPKRIIIYHVSSRYNSKIKLAKEELNNEFPNIQINIVHPEKVFKI